MTTLKQLEEELEIQFKRIDQILPQIERLMPLNVEVFEDIEHIKTIDSFIYRFSKLQDRMGEKLFPAILEALEEYNRRMSLIDVLNRLERLELLEDANLWIDYRKLRNFLTHEYPDNQEERLEALAMACEAYYEIKTIYRKMLKRVG
ncbi:MAG: hypothetical protein U9N49_12945 [Campylobacterota bacterium]|nr:hypothetical protein [Campylobacterota bacterium]